MIGVVCFDLMDTLVRDPYREALRAATGEGPEGLAARRDPTAWPAFERGELDAATFAARVLPDGGFDLAAFDRARRAGYAWLPGMRGLLDELEGVATRWLATNYPAWVEELLAGRGVLGGEGVGARVEGVTASYRVGVRKPDPGFFATLLEATGSADAPGRCLLVDDRAVNCEAAAAHGLAVHHFDGAEGLRRRLALEGLLPDRPRAAGPP